MEGNQLDPSRRQRKLRFWVTGCLEPTDAIVKWSSRALTPPPLPVGPIEDL
jgi:hypothetical protein